MIKSMTGFGKAVCELPDKKITVEIRTLNSKQLDLNLRISHIYREKEPELRSEFSKSIERGKADISIFVEYTGENRSMSINRPLAKNYYNELKSLAADLNEEVSNYLPMIIKMQDVMKAEKQELDEKEWIKTKAAVMKALEELNRFRTDEGKTLGKEFTERISNIQRLLKEVEAADPHRITNIRERIARNLNEFLDKEKIDQNRLEQEIIYYVEKIDITEEKLRLKTHCDYFLKTMQEASAGRKLGFISQEIGREINTIGSKANDVSIQKIVVQMKDELEKIKEQLLNLL